MIRGIVTGLIDDGSIVIMQVQGEDAEVDVFFDQRRFLDMVARVGPARDMLEREVEVRGELAQGTQTVEFDPDPEWADVEADQLVPGD